MHADIGEELLSGILQAGTKDVDHIIDNEKAVVVSLTVTDCDGGILLVMTLHVELLLLRELACVYGGRDVGITIAEHRQGIDIDIIVDKDDGCIGLFDEADDVSIGIEDLSVVEDAFNWWKGRADEEIHFVF